MKAMQFIEGVRKEVVGGHFFARRSASRALPPSLRLRRDDLRDVLESSQERRQRVDPKVVSNSNEGGSNEANREDCEEKHQSNRNDERRCRLLSCRPSASRMLCSSRIQLKQFERHVVLSNHLGLASRRRAPDLRLHR